MTTRWMTLVGCVALSMSMARPAQADFSATNYAGCILWLDANDLDGDGVAEGNSESGLVAGKVDRWRDKSGYVRDAVQSTDADRPSYVTNALNGKAWVDFPWRKDMWITNAVRPQTAATLFMVVNPVSVLFPAPYHYTPFTSDSVKGADDYFRYETSGSASGAVLTTIYRGTRSAIGSGLRWSGPIVFAVESTPLFFNVWQDGALFGSAAPGFDSSNGTNRLGSKTATSSYKGGFLDLVIYDREISGGFKKMIGYELSQKYNLVNAYQMPGLWWQETAAANVGGHTATVQGELRGTNANVTMFWDVSDNGVTTSAWSWSVSLPSQATGTVSCLLANLEMNRQYWFRFLATNVTSGESDWSAPRSFTTLDTDGPATLTWNLQSWPGADGNPKALNNGATLSCVGSNIFRGSGDLNDTTLRTIVTNRAVWRPMSAESVNYWAPPGAGTVRPYFTTPGASGFPPSSMYIQGVSGDRIKPGGLIFTAPQGGPYRLRGTIRFNYAEVSKNLQKCRLLIGKWSAAGIWTDIALIQTNCSDTVTTVDVPLAACPALDRFQLANGDELGFLFYTVEFTHVVYWPIGATNTINRIMIDWRRPPDGSIIVIH